MKENMKVYSGSASKILTKAIIGHLGFAAEGNVHLGKFPDGEIEVQLLDNARGRDVYIVQSMNDPVNDNIMELLIMIDAAKRSSASRITAVIPFFGYARQDRKDKPRVPISAKLVANMLTTAGADRILTIDLHSPQIQGFFDIPVDHLYARPVFFKAFKMALKINHPLNKLFTKEGNLVMVAPDTGAAKEIYKYADIMGCGFAIVGKQRTNGSTIESKVLVGDVDGKTAIMVDDLTTTCGTLCGAAEMLKSNGAVKIAAAVTHNLMTKEGYARLKASPIDELITTDTVDVKGGRRSKIVTLSVSKLFAEAIHNTHTNESVSSLFEIEK